MNKMFLLSLLLVLVSAVMVFPQDLLLETHGVSPAEVARDTVGNPHYLGVKDRVSTGLANVGVETKVYLKATFEDSMITDLMWDLTAPGGSEASLSTATEVDSASEIVTLVPDVLGTYTVIVTEGTYADTVVMNAAKFLGVEKNCKNCHSGAFGDQYTPWSATGHATFLDEALDGIKSSHYGEGCVSCHTVGFDAMANNDGFDDFEFVFPGVLEPGMADSMYATYPAAMDRANIQCENCHGPGSAHNGATTDGKMVVDIGPDACAACHDDDHYHVYPSQWKVSNHASLNRPYTRASCAPCHNGQGFIDWVDGGKMDIEEDLAENHNITCAVCHDPHEATNEYQLRTLEATLPSGDVVNQGGLGKLCMNCHNSRRTLPDRIQDRLDNSQATGPHHGPQAEMLTTLNTWTFGEDLPTSPHLIAAVPGGEANSCVTCHMYEIGSHGEFDENHELNTSGMHSFAMVNQKGVDNVAACEDCHGIVGETFAEKKFYINGNADHDGNGEEEGLQLEVQGLMDTLYSVLPTDEDGDFVVDSATTGFDVAAAIYNWEFVLEDRSLGIHNPAFTVSLLQLSIAKVRDDILSISPVLGIAPTEYSISQNYPNPFNPYTQIDFSIKKAGRVSIKVYDMLGREVATLVDDNMQAGTYKARFDGAQFASGIYMYRIIAEDYTAIKKMVLLK